MNNILRSLRKILTMSRSLSSNTQSSPQVEQKHKTPELTPRFGKSEPAPQFGKMVYSSKSQAELEAQAGEKLFKVSDGVYVNQATQEFIQSEYQPVIENGSPEEFSSYNFEKSGIACATWHPNEPKLICIVTSPTSTTICLVLSIEKDQLTLVSETTIALPNQPEQIKDVAHHPLLSYLLITCDKYLFVWDYADKKLVGNIDLDRYDLAQGGFYPDAQRAWALSMDKDHAGYDWVIWDYSVNEVNHYELERHGHYGRGATLHPSGLLIGAAWNAYECGYLIHTSEPKSQDLYYYSQPAPERSEYEAYSPCFSPDGKRLAFVVNPYLAMHKNHSKVCVYEMETGELQVEFYTGTRLNEEQLQFVYVGNTLAFRESDSDKIHVFDSRLGKRIKTLTASSAIRYFTGHRLFGYYAVIHETGISIFFSSLVEAWMTSNQSFEQTALDIAKRFIAANDVHLVSVNG